MNDAEYIAAIAGNYKNRQGPELQAHYERLIRISAALAAAQDAERKPLSKEQRAEIMEEVDSYNFPEDLIDATEKAHGIAAQQGDSHD